MWNMPQRQGAWVFIHHIQFPTGAGLFTLFPFSRIKSSVSLSCFCAGQTPYPDPRCWRKASGGEAGRCRHWGGEAVSRTLYQGRPLGVLEWGFSNVWPSWPLLGDFSRWWAESEADPTYLTLESHPDSFYFECLVLWDIQTSNSLSLWPGYIISGRSPIVWI